MDTEKRGCPRQKAPSIAATVHDTQGYYNGMISDISLKGLSVLVGKETIRYGDRYEIKFALPVKGRYLPVQVQGSAVYTSECGALGSKVGLQLAAIDTLSLWTIEAFLKTASEDKNPISYQWDSPLIL